MSAVVHDRPETAAGFDDLYPRDEEHRYRLYALKNTSLTVLAAAPDLEGIGTAIGQRHEDQKAVGEKLSDLGSTGILDAVNHEWIVSPFPRNERLIR